MATSGLETVCNVHVPPIRLALPQSLAIQIANINCSTSLVLSIPVDTATSLVDPRVKLLSLRPQEVAVHWKVDTAFMTAADGPRLGAEVEIETDHTPPELEIVTD